MKLKRSNFILTAIVLVALAAPSTVWAQGASDTGSIRSRILQTIGVTNNTELSFGSVIPFFGPGWYQIQAGGSGHDWDNVRIQSHGTSAYWIASGDANASFRIDLPSSVIVSDPHGATMTVNSFAHNQPATPVLSANGFREFWVGATLHVGGSQPPGLYSGSYTVFVSYE